ncbi:FecR family protein [uncultured Psychrosphaera sp.]|uniref:FecR family protein n=1 Tax=uncultured Psychrosphaera sp. TaxID=1403522 RepID=UPI0026313FBA|nr:FecR family protein [uncultured Psychrosphaera sp.]
MNTYKVILGLSLLTALNVNAQSTAGKTLISKGKVTASANDVSRDLKRRSVIFDSDVITTGKNSKAQLRMTDGGMIALKQNTELQITDYHFSDENGKGSVVMELVKGGLRSVTGAIKAKNGGDYNLKTPTGSIGIRGTHYEVELIDGEMFLAVWDGAVDVTVDSNGGNTVSFGQGENFSFGVVSAEGKVTELLEAPKNFSKGHSTNDSEGENEERNNAESDSASEDSSEAAAEDVAISDDADAVTNMLDDNFQQVEDDIASTANDAFSSIQSSSTEELLSERSGSFTYSNLESFQVNSSAGAVSDFSIEMDVNFDLATVPTGQLSFNDAGGEWFAAFSGIISADQLELDISFASHADNLADGDINASFFDGLDSIIGEFDLHEIRNTNNRVDGSFLLK